MRSLLAALGIAGALALLTTLSVHLNPPAPVDPRPLAPPRPMPSFVPTTTTLPAEEQLDGPGTTLPEPVEVSDSESAAATEPEAEATSPPPTTTENKGQATVDVPRRLVRLGPGTEIKVRPSSEIDSERASVEDRFRAVLTKPLMAGGMELVESGALVEGIVTRVDQPGRASGKARIDLELRRVRAGDTWVSVTTETLERKKGGGSGDAIRILGGAVAGAIGGAMADGKRGAKRGAAGGAAAGATVSLATRGPKVVLSPKKELSFDLSQPAFFPHPQGDRQ